MSGRDQCYALPELQQWESAQVENYVWGEPDTIDGLAKGMDTAGTELVGIADSLKGVDVSSFWRGGGAEAFVGLRDRVEPAVRGVGSMHKDAGAALQTWKNHLTVYKEDCGTAITTGRAGWHLYQTTSCDNQEAQTKMSQGKTGITNAQGSATTSGRTCKTALEAAVAKAKVPTQAPPTQPTQPISSKEGERGKAPSGREPIPAPPPYAPGLWIDPANGQLVQPKPGPWAVGQQPWEYTPGSQPNPGFAVPATGPTTQPSIFSTPPANPPQAPSGQTPVPFTGPITGTDRPLVDPANGRVVIPVTGVYAAGQPWPYVYADGRP